MTAHAGLFSSPRTCDIVARRNFRENSRQRFETTRSIASVFEPLIIKFLNGGKPRRGDLRSLTRQIEQTLKADPNVLLVEIETVIPPPSLDESYCLRVLNRSTEIDESDTYYSSTKVQITRKDITVFGDRYGLYVVPHVMSRYMQRERKPIETFHADIMRPLRMALPFGWAAACHDIADFAIPFASGLIVGEAWCEHDMASGYRVFYPRGGEMSRSSGSARQPFMRDKTINLRGITFIGGDEIFGDKLYLREELSAFEVEHRDNLDKLFRFQAFNDPIEDRVPMLKMFEAALKLTEGPAWSSMLYQRRRKLEAA